MRDKSSYLLFTKMQLFSSYISSYPFLHFLNDVSKYNNYRAHQQNPFPMLRVISYLYQTLKQQLIDEIVTFTEITEYYIDSLQEKIEYQKKVQSINQRLRHAKNYNQWKSIANDYDKLPQNQEKLNRVHSPYYDYEYIEGLKNQLEKSRKQEQISKLITIIRSHSYRNIGNINSPRLYRNAYNSTQKVIEEFQLEIVRCLRMILGSDLPVYKKMEFFGELRHSVGRSALLLSGGAILGMYHIGVAQTLIQADCLPRIIAGSSAGSMIAAFLCTKSKQQFFDGSKMNFSAFINKKKHSLWKKIKRVTKDGYVLDIDVLKNFLKDNIGQMTFQEAFDKFGYILNITVTGNNQHDEDRLLNYLTAPNVMVWSACAASCAIPFLYGATDLFCKDADGEIKPYTLMNRKFLDGSIAHDLPMNKLSVFFNVNNFIVSQTNPWVIPFMDYTEQFRTSSNPIVIKILLFFNKLKQFIISEIKHRISQMVAIFPGAITKFFNLATQNYIGNITIWPVPTLKTYFRILENPTDFSMILNFVEDGKFRTYPKICQIKSSLFYQKQINYCFRKVKNESSANMHPISRLRGLSINRKNSQQIEQQNESLSSNQDYNVKKFEMVEFEDDCWQPNEQERKQNKYRNQSFMIPRGNSYT